MDKPHPNHTPIAIIGMGCLFPKSPNLAAYWRLLVNGEDAICEVPESHWSRKDFFDANPKSADHVYCTRGGFLDPVSFDPTEFGIPPANLEATDTSQLLALIAAKRALEDAGYGPDQKYDRSRVSVVLGVTGTQELVIPLGARLGHPIWRQALEKADVDAAKSDRVVEHIANAYVPWQENSFPGLLGNVVAGRIANRFDLGGTNCVVDAACGSSLAAVNHAILELTAGNSDMVVTGGVDTLNDIFMHMCFSQTGVLSGSGDASPFSSRADGTVLGEGIGIVVLKHLEKARKDNDRIYGVIRAMGASSDGRSQSIYAPRAEGQKNAIRRAYEAAHVAPDTIGLIEAHGTGTRIGDQVEFSALCDFFGDPETSRSRNGYRCGLGSVKSMIGHTKAAAGVAGLIKAVLALHHKMLPPTLKAETPDPKLGLQKSPFYLCQKARPWLPPPGMPRRAGVSAFGFGGSNFHAVLEEASPEKQDVVWNEALEIVSLGADSHGQLKDRLLEFQRKISQNGSLPHLAAETRATFDAQSQHRLLAMLDVTAGIDSQLTEIIESLQAQKAPGAVTHFAWYGNGVRKGKTAFLFPGQGSQYVQMGLDWMASFPEAFAVVAKADRLLTTHMFPLPPENPETGRQQEEALRRTDVAQPALGAVSLAMLQVLRRFGIKADATAGHSFGELTALHAAGWIDEPGFFELARRRGELMAAAGDHSNSDPGAMLAVRAPLSKIEALMDRYDMGIVLANRNSPDQGVLSGPTASIEKAAAIFKKEGIRSVRLPVAAAFHSPLVAAAQGPFAQALTEVDINPQPVKVYANSTAENYPEDASAAREILAGQLARPVLFEQQIRQMHQDGIDAFIEIGPRKVLGGLIRAILPQKDILTLSLDGSGDRENGCAMTDLAEVLCQLAARGLAVDWSGWYQPPQPQSAPRMQIQLTGANYKNPNRPKQPTASQTASKMETKKENASLQRPQKNAATNLKASADDHLLASQPAAAPLVQPDSNATSAIAQGLLAMQSLHLKTAEAHQKFLDAQMEASRIIQQMLGVANNGSASAHLPVQQPDPGLANTTPAHPAVFDPPVFSEEIQPAAIQHPEPQKRPESTEGAPNLGENTLAPALLAVVSELTGYPTETLSMDMQIEADLGIDSIKRVEILSALEEKRPDLPSVAPEKLAQLQTLGEIADAFQIETAGTSPSPSAVSAATAPGPAAAPIADQLLAVVSELTGYPTETLSMDMQIEADLGIDSIKRVEILSALEEKRPDLPSVAPEKLAQLQTLGEIAAAFQIETTGTSLPPSAVPAATAPGPDATPVADQLLAVVSELTGYPPETLSMDMQIEADLGIDSIKRVEILSALEEKRPELPSVAPEKLAQLHTLGEIAAAFQTNAAPPATQQTPKEKAPQADAAPESAPSAHKAAPAPRFTVDMVPEALSLNPTWTPPSGSWMIVAADGGPWDHALVPVLEKAGIQPLTVSLLKPETPLPENLAPPMWAGMLLLPPGSDETNDDDRPAQQLSAALQWVRRACRDLAPQTRIDAPRLMAVTAMDGCCGHSDQAPKQPIWAGVAALIKTASREHPSFFCRSVDLDPSLAPSAKTAQFICEELLASDAPAYLEVGRKNPTRTIAQVQAASYPNGSIALQSKEVVVVSGGARGITPTAIEPLARQIRPTLVFLGRSKAPQKEPDWLANVSGEAQMKREILKHQFQGKAKPIEIQSFYRSATANREIIQTLEQMRALGATAEYVQADVTDRAQLGRALTRIRREFGSIRGIIHAAGVLKDSLIVDKSAEAFAEVYAPKITGLKHLLAETQKDPLSTLVLFSSVCARFGNRGQSDYAMANEAMNKIAHGESIRRKGLHCVSINWGPWDGGMVTPAIKKEFSSRGIDLITHVQGGASLFSELHRQGGDSHPTEVVIGSLLPTEAEPLTTPRVPSIVSDPKTNLTTVAKRRIDRENHPVLMSHVLDSVPVVPLALISEWLGHGALHEHPGLVLRGLDQLRVLNGIKLTSQSRSIRLLAGKAQKQGDAYHVEVELHGADAEAGKETLHARAQAILAADYEPHPGTDLPQFSALPAYKRSIEQIYTDILFHGPRLQGIDRIDCLTSEFMAARILAAPAPRQWIQQPLRSRWIADPLVVDGAFQMASLWCYEQQGMVSLPSFVGSYRQYRSLFPANGSHVMMKIHRVRGHKLEADFSFLDEDGQLVARIDGFEAVMDKSLEKAFRARHAA